MKKYSNKFLLVIFLIVILILAFSQNVFATIIPGGIEKYAKEPTASDAGSFLEMANKVLGVILVIGIIVAVAGIFIIGIKFMLGSVEEKAEYKKMMLPYLIGFILLLSISAFVELIYLVAKNASGAVATSTEQYVVALEEKSKQS